MNVMTEQEVRQFEQKHSWATGIKSDECGNLFYDSPQAYGFTSNTVPPLPPKPPT